MQLTLKDDLPFTRLTVAYHGAALTTDQRGYPRLGKCDIGAYEFALNVYLPLVRK